MRTFKDFDIALSNVQQNDFTDNQIDRLIERLERLKSPSTKALAQVQQDNSITAPTAKIERKYQDMTRDELLQCAISLDTTITHMQVLFDRDKRLQILVNSDGETFKIYYTDDDVREIALHSTQLFADEMDNYINNHLIPYNDAFYALDSISMTLVHMVTRERKPEHLRIMLEDVDKGLSAALTGYIGKAKSEYMHPHPDDMQTIVSGVSQLIDMVQAVQNGHDDGSELREFLRTRLEQNGKGDNHLYFRIERALDAMPKPGRNATPLDSTLLLVGKCRDRINLYPDESWHDRAIEIKNELSAELAEMDETNTRYKEVSKAHERLENYKKQSYDALGSRLSKLYSRNKDKFR